MSERAKTPLALLQRIIDDNPKATEQQHRARFMRMVKADRCLQRAVIDEAVTEMICDCDFSKYWAARDRRRAG